MKQHKYICPVCGYDQLDEPAYDENFEPSYKFCPCCKLQFGGADYPFDAARDIWVKSSEFKAHRWKHKRQLKNLELPEIARFIDTMLDKFS